MRARARSRQRPPQPKAGRDAHEDLCLLHGEQGAAEDGKAKRRPLDLPPPIGPRLRELRRRKNLTLSDVEALSGISKSMLSQIERGKVNPTFARVWHLTRSLGVAVGELLGEAQSRPEGIRLLEHIKVYSTPVVTSADGLRSTRILSPIRLQLPFEWYEITLKPGGSLRANAHGNGAWEHMTLVAGRVVAEIGSREIALGCGDTVRYSADQPHGVRNDERSEAKVLLVVVALKELPALNINLAPLIGPDRG